MSGSTAEVRTPSAVATGRPRVTPLRVRDVRDAAPAADDDLHAVLIAACAHHHVDAAVATTTEIWTALLSELEEIPDGTV